MERYLFLLPALLSSFTGEHGGKDKTKKANSGREKDVAVLNNLRYEAKTLSLQMRRRRRWKEALPGSVVHHHGVPGRASDAVVVLEQPQVAPPGGDVVEERPRRETVRWMVITTETTHVSQSQAKDDFCRSARDKKHTEIWKKTTLGSKYLR